MIAMDLLNKAGINPKVRMNELKPVILQQCWINMLDPSMIESTLYDASYEEPDFRDFVMSCMLMKYEWLP